jgi:hypothetical protein
MHACRVAVLPACTCPCMRAVSRCCAMLLLHALHTLPAAPVYCSSTRLRGCACSMSVLTERALHAHAPRMHPMHAPMHARRRQLQLGTRRPRGRSHELRATQRGSKQKRRLHAETQAPHRKLTRACVCFSGACVRRSVLSSKGICLCHGKGNCLRPSAPNWAACKGPSCGFCNETLPVARPCISFTTNACGSCTSILATSTCLRYDRCLL